MTLIGRHYRHRRQRGRFNVAGIDELIEAGEVNVANDFALTFRDVLTDERRKLPEQLYHCAFRMTAAICGREFGNSRLAELAE